MSEEGDLLEATAPAVQHLLIPPFSKEEENNGSSSTTPTSGKVVSPLFARKGTMTGSSDDDALPTNVTKVEQLADLPKEFLSSGTTIQKDRPLRYEDDTGQVYHYSLRPMTYSVILILLVELLERFAFYGINYTQTAFLTGVYNPDWSASMDSVAASSYVSISIAIAYTAPFLGALLSDSFFGEYWSIVIGCLVFYLPGMIIIMITTIPGLLGDTFDTGLLKVGLLFLWPMGTGVVKSIVNVFGAKQHHPILQSSLVESYYVSFYMCINVGALAGGIIVPIMAQHNVTIAYCIPIVMLGVAVTIFTLGTPRYVRTKPKGDLFTKIKTANGNDAIGPGTLFLISALIIPFNIAYSQMATTFIVQGTVMERAFGFIDAASMNNCDAISVLLFGYLVAEKVYPALAERGIRIPTTYKFAIGSFLGALAIGMALINEYRIHSVYNATGEKISILWQSFCYFLIGMGEIFAVSAAYEVAFTASPPQKKVLASAVNLFCVGGIPNFLCIGLYNACEHWFQNDNGTTRISRIEDYTEAHVCNYFWVLFGIAVFGIFVNMLPSVRDWVASIEDQAADDIKTPIMRKKRPIHLKEDAAEADEETALLRVKQHREYMEYGKGPILYKHASMRAGPVLSHSEREAKSARNRRRAKREKQSPTLLKNSLKPPRPPSR